MIKIELKLTGVKLKWREVMIGLSLSFCVKDIVLGKVALADVEFIVAGTCVGSAEEWQELLNQYSKTYWEEFPERAREVALQLVNDGRVIQPRLESGSAPRISRGVWIENPLEVEYFQATNLQQVREAMARWERKHAVLH